MIIISHQYSINIPAHKNIYSSSTKRELRIDYSIPQNGVNKNTGLLILVPGFGGNIDSNVYKKMRSFFADKYNLITIQCNYFGSSFMQGTDSFQISNSDILYSIFSKEELELIKQDSSEFINLLSKKKITLPVKANLDESLDEFNDMSYMQMIDIVTAIEAIKIILQGNNLVYDSSRVIGYGHSHGAYLLHLANNITPSLFSYVIDNSAWLEPVYLSSNRYLYQNVGHATLAIEFDYMAKKSIKNIRALNLSSVYHNYNGKTQILAFQGNNDNLVNYLEKKRIIEGISNSKFILVTEDDIDNIKYKSNTHGLNADSLELFSYALEFEFPNKVGIEKNNKYTIDLKSLQISVDHTNGLPVFDVTFN